VSRKIIRPDEAAMSIHHFTLTITGLDFDDTDRLYEAGCDDALLSMTGGMMQLDFAREAPDLWTALNSAIENVWSAGAAVRHVEPIREREPA
jgi:hypothetical protein